MDRAGFGGATAYGGFIKPVALQAECFDAFTRASLPGVDPAEELKAARVVFGDLPQPSDLRRVAKLVLPVSLDSA